MTARSSGSRAPPSAIAPQLVASAASIGALELWISPGPSGSPGARSSSPVHRTATRGLRATATVAPPAATAAPSSTAPSRVPPAKTSDPDAMSSPRGRTFSPGAVAAMTST